MVSSGCLFAGKNNKLVKKCTVVLVVKCLFFVERVRC